MSDRVQAASSDQFSAIPALPGCHGELVTQTQGGSETIRRNSVTPLPPAF